MYIRKGLSVGCNLKRKPLTICRNGFPRWNGRRSGTELSLSTIPEGYPARIANSAAEAMGRTQKKGTHQIPTSYLLGTSYPTDTKELSS